MAHNAKSWLSGLLQNELADPWPIWNIDDLSPLAEGKEKEQAMDCFLKLLRGSDIWSFLLILPPLKQGMWLLLSSTKGRESISSSMVCILFVQKWTFLHWNRRKIYGKVIGQSQNWWEDWRTRLQRERGSTTTGPPQAWPLWAVPSGIAGTPFPVPLPTSLKPLWVTLIGP